MAQGSPICTRMILDEEQKLNPPPPIYSRDVDDKRASEWTGQHADFAPQQQQSTSTSYYAASPAGSSSLASTSAHPSFSRPRASGLPYQAFKSTYLAARGRSLDKGFSVSPPPSQEVPHPFVTHDVNEDDWLRCVVRAFSHEIGEYIFFLCSLDSFLEDLRRAGSLTEKDISRSHLPIISWVPFVSELSYSYVFASLSYLNIIARRVECIWRAEVDEIS